jgi:hypothetical protein
MLVNTKARIESPLINQVVFYNPWRDEPRKKPYPVIINSGSYYSNNRISNHWYWQRVSPTGRINPKIEYGYGSFTVAEGYKISRKIKVL